MNDGCQLALALDRDVDICVFYWRFGEVEFHS
jgi:hypothetical protein